MSAAIAATADPTSRLRITRHLPDSKFLMPTQVENPAYRGKSSRELAEQPLLTCVIFAALDGQLLAGRKHDLFETKDMRAVFREIACHCDLIPRLKRIFGPAIPGQAQRANRFHDVLLGFASRFIYLHINFSVRINTPDTLYGSLQGHHL